MNFMAQLSNRDIIIRLLKSDLSDYDNLLSLLGMANEVLSEDKELSKKLANKVRFLALRLCSTGDIKYYNLYNQALLFLAQKHKDFDSYLLYVEKDRDPEDRYYQPRRNKIYWLVQKMQRLMDDELDILSISMPPGTGKTTLGEFFISFVMGHYPNTPNLMSSHSGFMTRMFYDAVLNIITSNEYCWSDVFPDVIFEGNNAKEETINLGRWQPFKTLTCRPIRGSLTGVTRCEGFLYVDDLVSGIEEALSIDRLDKLYGEYTTDLKSRKKKKAKEIHIATRWSVHDVIGRLERMYEGNPRAEFIAVPDIDPKTGKSNFDYDYDVGFDEKYFHDMEMSMDDVSYRCLYKSDPIEREGILYHPTELQRYLGGLPDREPDSILAICDTKDTGTDYNFLGVFYQYGDRYYLEDLVFKNIDPGTLDELNSDMLVKHHVQQAQFESNKEGSRTANEVDRLVKAKGGRCHITKKYTTQNKETKIIVNSSWVKEHVIFKDITEYEPKSDYGVMMSFLCSYTQLGKNKHDDAPDALAMFAQFVDALLGGEGQVVKRSDLGI
jgi:predicted phage terminase large subunit-like protein